MSDSQDRRRLARFHNRYSRAHHGPSWALLKFVAELATSPFEPPEVARVAPTVDALRSNRNATTATWIGHASFLLQQGGYNLLTDPVLSERASPFSFAGPKRLQAPGLTLETLPPIDLVLLSHDHYDHCDLPTLQALRQRDDPVIVAPLRLGQWLGRRGFDRWVELDWWEQHQHQTLHIHAVPVQHFSGRAALDRNRRLWAGFIIESPGWRCFFAGDSGYSRDFADIGARFAPIDLALLPIGAYEPRAFMAPVHANPEEAVRMHQDLGARRSIGMHWGTFRLTTEPMNEPPQRLQRAVAAAGLPAEAFITVALGETLYLDEAAGDTAPADHST
ncbi:MAG: MBL fold metallo-hydrolase [Algiphilus sp.]|uniref:MBL fold metallo-hydrolase n=1 Tax=Algiphilus sp. TaxID=1872431 RepID=UPI0025B7BF1E|nr:MBL fold metallo-hydrolase [Algiphilus sp.]MCI5103901.1 MBL fold metallo-hydrolase [Algiphilus sp.]